MYVEAAKGWCELHAYPEAEAELEKVSPELRNHPVVLEARWQMCANLERWEAALDAATALVGLAPESPEGWIYKGSALVELKRLAEAHQTLSLAAAKFSSDEIILYDLACVCCAMGRVDESKSWLGKAIDAGGNPIKLRALDDPDLEPLWDSLRQP
jgi:predicted Zn-dependent protease